MKKIYRKGIILGLIILFLISALSFNITFGIKINTEPLEKEDKNIENIDNDNLFVPGELIVKFKQELNFNKPQGQIKTTDITSIDDLNEKYGVKFAHRLFSDPAPLFLSNVYILELSEGEDVLTASTEYSKNPYIVFAEPNYILPLHKFPNDPYFENQWGLNEQNDSDVDAPEAWDIETGDPDVIIAILDSGIDYNHEDLKDNIWINKEEDRNNNGRFDNWLWWQKKNGIYGDIDIIDNDGNGYIDDVIGWDFGDSGFIDDNDPMDTYGHGTHCAGIASAVTNNGIGIAGVAWDCSIMAVKIFGDNVIPTSELTKGIVYAADNNASVISMSLGWSFPSILISNAVKYAYKKGVTLVASAGNYNDDFKNYPAGYDEVISVAATNYKDERAFFSSYGEWVDVAAPGLDIYSTLPDYSYSYEMGTSMSGPMVAGLAGLIKSKNKNLDPGRIREIIEYSVDRLDPTFQLIRGRINVRNALQRGTGNALSRISFPKHGADVKEIFEIKGSAMGEGFQNYVIEYSPGNDPEASTWVEVFNSTHQVENDILCSFNTERMDEGIYIFKLKVTCDDGVYTDTIWSIVNNVKNEFLVDDDGNADYNSIQDAIYDCGDGDVVHVRNGTYFECLKIFNSIELIGENKETTIIDAKDKGYVINILADNVKISGFSIANGFLGGIFLENSQNCVISCNKIYNNYPGIELRSSSNNVIFKNYFLNNTIGVRITKRSNRNLISKNNFWAAFTGLLSLHASHYDSYFNKWYNNYWQRMRILPYRIPYKKFTSVMPYHRPYLLRSNFDWRPALRPHEIPSTGIFYDISDYY